MRILVYFVQKKNCVLFQSIASQVEIRPFLLHHFQLLARQLLFDAWLTE